MSRTSVIRRKKLTVQQRSRKVARTIKQMGYLDAVSKDTNEDDNHFFYQRQGVML